VFATAIISNTSDTPVIYKAMQDSTGTFKAFPNIGMIRSKSFAMICYEFSPKSARAHAFSSQFIFNNSTANMQAVQLKGMCYGPAIVLP
jgi:hypothetical protein